ncbi:MAG: fructose-bisphosphatase class II [Desulfotalea sp.]
MNKNYGMEIVRATEIAALTAARIQGLGDKIDILNQARSALGKTLHKLNIEGHLINDRFCDREDIFTLPKIIGVGDQESDLMTIALEAHNSASAGKNNATTYAVIAKKGSILPLPNLKMYKIVVGPRVGAVIDIRKSPTINVKRCARKLGKYTENMTICILDKPSHQQLIEEIRATGARIKLIEEGEVSGCLSAITGEKADLYIGYGNAHEGSMAAAAVACLGGYFEGQMHYKDDNEKNLTSQYGVRDLEKVYQAQDLIQSNEVAIAATGITDGEFLDGVRFTANGAITSSFIARAETKTYRKLETRHFFDYKPVF